MRPPRAVYLLESSGLERVEVKGFLTAVGGWRRRAHSPPSFRAVDTRAGEGWPVAFSDLGRALHCSDDKVMPSSVWQKTCLCCTARRGPMQGPLHWEAEKGDIHVSQPWDRPPCPGCVGQETPVQVLVRGGQITDFASL